MKQFLEAFTIIDFWGIMVPGGFFAYFLNRFYPLGEVYKDIVGQYVEKPTELGLVVFLLVVSYIIGSLIHELADFFANAVSKAGDRISDDLNNTWAGNLSLRKSAFCSLSQSMRDKYKNGEVDADIKPDCREKSAKFQQYTNDILTVLYSKGKVGKISLFDSFRIMSRNSAAVIAIWLWISWWGKVDVFVADGITFLPSHRRVAFALICVFTWRSIHYACLKYKYAYESYYQLRLEEQKKADEKASGSQQAPAAQAE